MQRVLKQAAAMLDGTTSGQCRYILMLWNRQVSYRKAFYLFASNRCLYHEKERTREAFGDQILQLFCPKTSVKTDFASSSFDPSKLQQAAAILDGPHFGTVSLYFTVVEYIVFVYKGFFSFRIKPMFVSREGKDTRSRTGFRHVEAHGQPFVVEANPTLEY